MIVKHCVFGMQNALKMDVLYVGKNYKMEDSSAQFVMIVMDRLQAVEDSACRSDACIA